MNLVPCTFSVQLLSQEAAAPSTKNKLSVSNLNPTLQNFTDTMEKLWRKSEEVFHSLCSGLYFVTQRDPP